MKHLITYILLFVCVFAAHAQINYRKELIIAAPSPNTVNIATENTTEYIAKQEIVLSAGFEVKAVGSSASKYYLAKINPDLVLSYNTQYALLTKDLTSGHVSTLNGKLYFKYDEKYLSTGTLNYKIYTHDRTQLSVSPLTISNIGANFFQVDMDAIVGSITTSDEKNYYVLEVTNSKNEKWYLRFKYVQEK